ncbi:hypothetical protein PInf_024732 [Phytophthora infestans]|nr:hypothetical protein PInf_024732 [Phytophthora infestans]
MQAPSSAFPTSPPVSSMAPLSVTSEATQTDINNVDAEPTQNKAEEEESDEPDDSGEEDWSDSDDADDISRDEEVLTGESEPEEQEDPSEEQGHNAKAAKRARLDHRAGMAAAAQLNLKVFRSELDKMNGTIRSAVEFYV